MAGILLEQDNLDDAKAFFNRLSPKATQTPEAKKLQAKLKFTGADIDLETLLEKVEVEPDNLPAKIELGEALVAVDQYEKGIDQFLEVLRRDRSYNDEAGRKAVLAVFSMLGPTDPVVAAYRPKLSALLFS